MRPQTGASRARPNESERRLAPATSSPSATFNEPGSRGVSPLLRGLVIAFLVAPMALLGTACEDKAIGRPCLTLADNSSPSKAEFNPEALECPSRLCIKPAAEPGALQDAMTAPFCTAECSSNSDCDDGETRDKDNVNDKRCTGRFVCATPFETGPLKCQKMCVCSDFFKDPKAATAVPASCVAQGS